MRHHADHCANCALALDDLLAVRQSLQVLRTIPAASHSDDPWFATRVMQLIASNQRAAEFGNSTWRAVPRVASRMAGVAAVFLLLASAVTINGFVSWGFSSIVIQLLRTMGTGEARAIQLGSLLGVLQVTARALDYVGGARWDGLTSGMIAAGLPSNGFSANASTCHSLSFICVIPKSRLL
jgi:hypothetical protein